MILTCYVIKDKKAGVFQTPFFSRSVVDALRQISSAASSGESMLNRFSADYSLYSVCSIDDDNGFVVATSEPVFIAEISSLVKGANNG